MPNTTTVKDATTQKNTQQIQKDPNFYAKMVAELAATVYHATQSNLGM